MAAGTRVIEFEVTRQPEIRVHCRDFHHSSIQWLGEARELRIVGEAHTLWRACRFAAPIVDDCFAEHLIELLLSQGLNLASLGERSERKASEVVRLAEELRLAEDVRDLLERRLRTLDGEERTERLIRELLDRGRSVRIAKGGAA